MLSQRPEIAVVGAGAVGCFFGGRLAQAGHPVTLIGRPSHVDAINRDGLWIDSQDSCGAIPVRASVAVSDAANADLILLAVKSADTVAVAKTLSTVLRPDALILSLQNGVDNCARLRPYIVQTAFPAVVYVAVGMQGPGRVKHFGRGELVIGDPESSSSSPSEDSLRMIARVFESAGIPCAVSPEIKRALWKKFLVNCTYNGISALGQIPYGKMVQVPQIQSLIEALTAEFIQVAQAEGVDLSPEEAALANQTIAQTMPGQRSSTAQDLARGKPTEIDYLNGVVVEIAHRHGISVPTHRAIHGLVKMLERHPMHDSLRQA
ncbi:MAG: 2-dehydropantoate 2-reductase [Betaproteobacteria bacterium]|jgi:2-dehydropantoate 2-reductase|nr:2-dehydropantoate 2-reductase [Betaproteobacteria bacterium]